MLLLLLFPQVHNTRRKFAVDEQKGTAETAAKPRQREAAVKAEDQEEAGEEEEEDPAD